MSYPVKGLPLDVDWPTKVHPQDWRNALDPDANQGEEWEAENDEDVPASKYVISLLGFDPDKETWSE